MLGLNRSAARAAIAIAAGEAALVTQGRVHTTQAPMLVDQLDLEQWTALVASLKAHASARELAVTVALPAQAAPLRSHPQPPSSPDWQKTAAAELIQEGTPVVVSGGHRSGPVWVCVTSLDTLRNLDAACRASGLRLEAVEPAALSLLRLAPVSRGTTVVVAASSTGCEIAAGQAGVPVLSRSAAARRPEDLTAEVELTVRYLEREGAQAISVTLLGPTVEALAPALRARHIEVAEVVHFDSAAAAVATGASRRPRGQAGDFLPALSGPPPRVARAAAATAALLLVASVVHAGSQTSAADALRKQVASLTAQHDQLQARLRLWTGPAAQAARETMTRLQQERVPVQFLGQLSDLVPDDLWIEQVEARSNSTSVRGKSLSRDSVLRFAGAFRTVWPGAVLTRIDLAVDQKPGPFYAFTIQTSSQGTPSRTPARTPEGSEAR